MNNIKIYIEKKEWGGMDLIELDQDREVEGSCECGNEPSGTINCWESIEWLHSWWALEYYSSPWC
jgi:hypothetical protein